MNRNAALALVGVAALAGAVAIVTRSDSEAATTQTRTLADVTGFCLYEIPDDQGQPVLHLRATAVCEERDAEGVVVRSEPCTVDKPASWWVDQGLEPGRLTAIQAIWGHFSEPSNVGKAVPRKRLDGTEVLEDLR
jgi:hypothetical protein